MSRGRNGRALLQPWADDIGAATNRDWIKRGLADDGSFVQRFHQATYRSVQRGGRIKFQLDDVNISQALGTKRFSDPFAAAFGRSSNVTSWELQQVLNNRRLYNATDFFIGNQRLSPSDVAEFGLGFLGR